MRDLLSIDNKIIWHPFTPLAGDPSQRVIERGEGALLFDTENRSLVDGISSWWVNIHGHARAEIGQAIAEQAAKLEHVLFAGFTHPPAIEVAEKLLNIAGPHYKRVFFSDNGSTAVEVALKLSIQARQRAEAANSPHVIVAFENAYHGDTFGAMSLSGRGIFNEPFSDLLFEVERIPEPTPGKEVKSFEAYDKLLRSKRVSTFIFEPLVLGAGGMLMYSAKSLEKLLEMSREAGVTTIADEVMTGFGRTGDILATQSTKTRPDLITLSKGITGGFLPLAVTLCSQKIVAGFESHNRADAFFHGHSYTANPLACAAASASLDLVQTEQCSNQRQFINEQHLNFKATLEARSDVADCRVTGTILAFDVVQSEDPGYLSEIREPLYNHFLEQGVLLRPLGNTIYIMPPYCIRQSELEQCYQAIISGLEVCLINRAGS